MGRKRLEEPTAALLVKDPKAYFEAREKYLEQRNREIDEEIKRDFAKSRQYLSKASYIGCLRNRVTKEVHLHQCNRPKDWRDWQAEISLELRNLQWGSKPFFKEKYGYWLGRNETKHTMRKLQSDYWVYGRESFEFRILEYMPGEAIYLLRSRFKYWAARLDCYAEPWKKWDSEEEIRLTEGVRKLIAQRSPDGQEDKMLEYCYRLENMLFWDDWKNIQETPYPVAGFHEVPMLFPKYDKTDYETGFFNVKIDLSKFQQTP